MAYAADRSKEVVLVLLLFYCFFVVFLQNISTFCTAFVHCCVVLSSSLITSFGERAGCSSR